MTYKNLPKKFDFLEGIAYNQTAIPSYSSVGFGAAPSVLVTPEGRFLLEIDYDQLFA